MKATREVMMGVVAGEYGFSPGIIPGYPHIRKVTWKQTVGRDTFRPATRAAMGSTNAIFCMSPHRTDVEAVLEGRASEEVAATAEQEEAQTEVDLYTETKSKADEIIADRLHRLDGYEMQELVAAVLRAMGMRTKVSPPGPDRGVDIVAYPDPLGFGTPRIKVQVKHRKGAIGAPEIRNFMSTLSEGDKGLFVSTGGFTKEALDEPERRGKAVTLLDQDRFIELMLEHYEEMETSYQAWVPLRRLYIPVEPEE